VNKCSLCQCHMSSCRTAPEQSLSERHADAINCNCISKKSYRRYDEEKQSSRHCRRFNRESQSAMRTPAVVRRRTTIAIDNSEMRQNRRGATQNDASSQVGNRKLTHANRCRCFRQIISTEWSLESRQSSPGDSLDEIDAPEIMQRWK
jgi:hypothetical protein